MEQAARFDTLLVCGVPVLQWRGAATETAIRHCQQILQALACHGYREVVLDLQQVALSAPQGWQRFLRTLEKTLPSYLHADVVLPVESQSERYLKRIRVVPSTALALSHLTRLPLASLQGAQVTHISWQELRDEE
ncbi:MAG: hypothetical protein NZ741_05370 [Armatimonadetes bacterium]|nr:hypothetical protein [Armatimonadota bacterium]